MRIYENICQIVQNQGLFSGEIKRSRRLFVDQDGSTRVLEVTTPCQWMNEIYRTDVP